MNEKQALVVDDHPIVRDGIKHLLANAFPSIHIRESQGTDGLLEEICGFPWAFVTLDMNLPGQNGLHVLKQAKARCPQIPIIVFSIFSEDHYGPRALRTGANAYLSKNRSPLDLVDVVKRVLQGEKQKLNKLTLSLMLSDRETEVLNLIAKGMDRKQIAQILGINEKTVSTYKGRLLEKLDARTTIDLIRFAGEEGLLSDSETDKPL